MGNPLMLEFAGINRDASKSFFDILSGAICSTERLLFNMSVHLKLENRVCSFLLNFIISILHIYFILLKSN